MTLPDDDDLRARFDAIRQADRVRAPDFHTVLDRAEVAHVSPRRRGHPLVWVAAAAGIVLAFGITLYQVRDRGADPQAVGVAPSGGSDAVTISTWRSPTASLLRTSGGEMLASPKLLSSILDGAARAALQH
jgi:hypothetical protein